MTQDVLSQLARLPVDATHLIVSAGGNDALSYGKMLTERAGSVAEVLHKLAEVGEAFQRRYGEMVQALLKRSLRRAGAMRGYAATSLLTLTLPSACWAALRS